MTDLSVVVTAHSETTVAGPTMRSADLAVQAARDAGCTVQTIIALDAATDATTRYFKQNRFDHWDRRVMNEADLGRVRNALVPELDGEFVAFLDADDLFSVNWLSDGVAWLKDAHVDGISAIAHPELNVFFDGVAFVQRNLSQDDPLWTPYRFYIRNYFDALCLAPREAHLEVLYKHNDIANGLAYEDWQFAVETMARGWQHVIVPDTIIFKRKRDESLVSRTRGRRSVLRRLPEMAIDRIAGLAGAERP